MWYEIVQACYPDDSEEVRNKKTVTTLYDSPNHQVFGYDDVTAA